VACFSRRLGSSYNKELALPADIDLSASFFPSRLAQLRERKITSPPILIGCCDEKLTDKIYPKCSRQNRLCKEHLTDESAKAAPGSFYFADYAATVWRRTSADSYSLFIGRQNTLGKGRLFSFAPVLFSIALGGVVAQY